jgi:transposase-like protein
MDKQPIPETLLENVRQFADPQVAHDFFVQMRWPYGVACPRMGCGSAAVAYMAKSRSWYCNECKRKFTAKVGTIFEDSPIGFDKWLPALWLISSNRNGISSCEIARALKVTQKSAWFMMHRIRDAMHDEDYRQFTGTVEADETFIGGKWHNKPLKTRRALGRAATVREAKTPVFGVVERSPKGTRKGRVRTWTVPSTQRQTLLPKLRETVHHDATVMTDSSNVYAHIDEFFLWHYIVDHHILEYVRGNAHVNNIECFWAVLKRTLGGTYIHCLPRHLDRYLDEQVFRFNERENDDGPRFVKATKGADGKRLTYKALTASSVPWRLKPGRARKSPL